MKPDLDISTMIVELRAEISVEEIARRARVSRNHVYRLQSGECRRPGYETVRRLEVLQRSLEKTPRKI